MEERILEVVYESLTRSRQGNPPPDTWLEILRGCLQGKTYAVIETDMGYAVGSVKDCAHTNLWPPLSQLTGEQVGKRNCRTVLARYLKRLDATSSPPVLGQQGPQPPPQPPEWGQRADTATHEVAQTLSESPSSRSTGAVRDGLQPGSGVDASDSFQPLPRQESDSPATIAAVPAGREAELAQVLSQIRQQRRFVFIYGLPGSQKTGFVQAIATTLRSEFDYPPVWCQAEEVPTPAALYHRVCTQTQTPPSREAADGGMGGIQAHLKQWLRQHRVLIVVDHTDSLYRPAELAGTFTEAAAGYQRWLSSLLTEPFYAGCLIWVGQVLPRCLQGSADSHLVYHHPMASLNASAAALLNRKRGGPAAAAAWSALLQFCGGHPGFMTVAIQQVEQRHQGNVQAYLQQPQLKCDALLAVLPRLTAAEQTLLLWIMLKPLQRSREWEETGLLPGEREPALESLQRRCLLRWNRETYCYQLSAPALRVLLALFLVDKLSQELQTGRFDFLCRVPLLATDTSVSGQTWQRQRLLQPLVRFLDRLYPDPDAQRAWLRNITGRLYDQPRYGQSYAAGNLLNLAIAWGMPLSGLILSGLTLKQVDLRRARVGGLVTQSCVFVEVLFPTGLTPPLRAAMSPDGTAVVVGDGTGRVTWWLQEPPGYCLKGFRDLGQAVDAVAVTGNRIAVAIAASVYCWWWDGQQQQAPGTTRTHGAADGHDGLIPLTLPTPVTCLAFSPDSAVAYLAMGLQTGQIILWDFFEEQQSPPVTGHSGYVTQLVFNAQATQLASIGSGNTVRCWALADSVAELQFLSRLEPNFDGVFVGLGWRDEDVCVLEYLDQSAQVALRVGEIETGYIAGQRILGAVFSQDGTVAVGSSDRGEVHLWELNPGAEIACLNTFPTAAHNLQLTHTGDWLLLGCDRSVQVWQAKQREPLWELHTQLGEGRQRIDLQGAYGVPPVYQALLS